MSQIIQPGAYPINVVACPAPLAHPVATTIATPQGAQCFVIGGMSPLAAIAGQIAAALAPHAIANAQESELTGGPSLAELPDELAKNAVAIAASVIHRAALADAEAARLAAEAASRPCVQP